MPRVPRPLAVGLAVSTALSLLAVPGVGYAAYRQDVALRDRLPAGTSIAGVEVGGLTRGAAVDAVRAVVQRDVDRPSSVTVADRTVQVTPRELGVVDDTEAVVDAALRRSAEGSWTSRAWQRVTGEATVLELDVDVTEPSREPVEALAEQLAADLDRPAVDAAVALAGGSPTWTPSTAGQAVDRAAVVEALLAGLEDGTGREVPLIPVEPQVTEEAFDTVLVVRTGRNVLEVYKGKRLVRTFDVATGAPGHSTPLGRTSVTLKRHLPTWVNPGSDWAKSMPARIGPGPGNPLGTRALNLGMPNIRIHGTPAPASIGFSVSKGCVRMRMPDVEALYDMVPTGTAVFVVSGGPPRLPTASAAAAPQAAVADAADGG
ncbi:MAG TPA: L,D-transpeptidase/peptidoglycan binding protein [Mycobacteriales bacterium]|nr:L,D-transpeptidase/peptidoglycan binding protein [Mycobacteriales bacterium]